MRGFVVILIILLSIGCRKDTPVKPVPETPLKDIEYDPSFLSLDTPDYFPQFEQPDNNKMTEEGVELGRFLFYDKGFSRDKTVSCATCHLPQGSFTDNLVKSVGIDGRTTGRSSMNLINVGFTYSGLFWDGRSPNLEEQAIHPIMDEKEMDNTWQNVVTHVQSSARYPKMFRKAFGITQKEDINRDLITKALAQFQRSIVSYESKFDKFLKGETILTDDELYGYNMYIDEDPSIPDAECHHCHSLPFGTSNAFFNNGLQEAATLLDFADKGRGKFTKDKLDNGKFRAPTIRNWKYSAPYMHNGSLATIDDVIEHYASGGKNSPNKDPLLNNIKLTEYDKSALKAFLETLNDEASIKKEAYQDPY